MGTTLLELFPFRRFRITSAAASDYGYVAGCIFICFVLTHSGDYFQPIAFG